jgi:hypothetical protein
MLTPIFDERFTAPGLPAGWYTDTPRPVYGNGAWDCKGRDGVIIPLLHDNWRTLRVEVDLDEVKPNANAFCGGDSRTALALVLLAPPHVRHQASDGGLTLARSAVPLTAPDGKARLVFEWTADRMRASANGVEALSAPNLRGSARAGSLQMGFSQCVVRRIAAFGDPAGPVPPAPRALRPGYPLEVTVDFNDDLMACAWSPKTFDSLFAELKSWGAQRVSWIDLGREADGYFDFAPLAISKHAKDTIRQAGDLFTAAVNHAHKEGLELIGLLKPFDMAIHVMSWPPFSEQARKHGRIAQVGCSYYWSTRMAAENQHLVMARKPSAHGPALNAAWTRIDLVKDDADASALAPADIAILVSDDNETFRPYAGAAAGRELIEDYPVYASTPSGIVPTLEKRRSRVFRFENLDIREPFMALKVAGAGRTFVNRLCDLVHVFGEKGEETRLTFGLAPRRADHTSQFGEAPAAGATAPEPGLQTGFEFDRYPGSPTSAWTSGGDAITTPLALDRGAVSYLAIARGKDRGTLAAFSPSFPETRALWMTWVRAMLDAGADGIDIRPGHHHGHFAWIEYGFEPPVRDAMLARTGVDIWETDDFDRDLWRRIRGEGYTQFLREASAEVRARGKTLTVHIDGYFDGPPGAGGAMNIVSDWRTWLEEGLADRVTGKSLWPQSSLALEVLALAHAKGVPVSYDPYCNNFFEDRSSTNHIGDSPQGCAVPVERLIDWGRRAGFDSFAFYECASALRARPDGAIGFRKNAEPLRDVLQRHFRSSVDAAAGRVTAAP